MIDYFYDGSPEGFLTVVFESYRRKEIPHSIYSPIHLNNGLFQEPLKIITDEEKAERVRKGISQKISSTTVQDILICLLSEAPDIELNLLAYIRLGFQVGPSLGEHLQKPFVRIVQNTRKKVLHEVHRLYGLTRFQELKTGMLYAPLEPDYNIIALLAPHFKRRFSNLNWTLHDLKRGNAVVYLNKDLIFTDIEELQEPTKNHFSTEESDFQSLWKNYFQSIAIPERKNPRLQKHWMPKRYWKHLTEKKP